MKNIFLFILFLSISVGLLSQVNQYDSLGRKHGLWKKKHSNSSALIYEGSFINGKPSGLFRYNYPNNTLKSLINHDHLTGKSQANFFHSNGGIMSEGAYKNQKKDSIWKNYTAEGKLSEISNFKDGKLNGFKQLYYITGKLAQYNTIIHSVQKFSNGVEEGPFFKYFMNGKIKIKGMYFNGFKDGLWEVFDANGINIISERYKNKKKNGWFCYRNNKNEITLKQYYFDGKVLKGKLREQKIQELKKQDVNSNN